jgi:Ca2+-binding RTX toxin-like protein
MADVGGGVSIIGGLAHNADTQTYDVFLRQGEVYDFWLGGVDTEGGFFFDDPRLTLSGPGPTLIADDDSAELRNASLIFMPTVTGTYTLTVEEETGGGTGGVFALTVTNRSIDDDVSDNTFLADDTGGVPVSAGLKGTSSVLSQGDVFHSDLIEDNRIVDVDVVAVFLTSGQTYRFDMRGLDTGDGDTRDPLLALLDRDGVEVSSDDNSGAGNNAAIVHVAGYTGWHFLHAGNVASTGPNGTYELQFTDISGAPITVDVPDTTATLVNVPLNGAVEGTIGGPADEDWYAINLVAGFEYRFTLTELGGTIDPHLTLFDSSGVQVTFDDNGGPGNDAEIVFTALADGLHFLGARDAGDTQTGTFLLEAGLLSAPPTPVHAVSAPEGLAAKGSNLDDSLTGGDGSDSIFGWPGNDTLVGGLGPDVMTGGSGNDSLDGGDGGDELFAEQGNDALLGGGGDDLMTGNSGNDTADGGADNDSMTGGDDDDTMAGGAGNDTVAGGQGDGTGGGNDSVLGDDGNDSVLGDDGNDTVRGGDGNDSISGGPGNDLLFGDAGDDTIDQVDATDTVVAGGGVDHILSLIGWTLDTDEENLTLLGATNLAGNGNGVGNVIFGNNGNNVLQGLGANDTVNGGAGNDTLIGGFGKDLNTGSGGLDHIKFNGLGESGITFATRDAINTFAHGDKIDLSAIDANMRIAGNQAFVFSSSQSLTGQTGIVIAQQVATNSFLVLADINGDAHADFSLNVYTSPGFGNFAGFDFIL